MTTTKKIVSPLETALAEFLRGKMRRLIASYRLAFEAGWNARGHAAAAEKQPTRKDAERLDFMLNNYRKVVVERLPSRGTDENLEVYVEEGFMGEKRYEAIPFVGDWDGNPTLAAETRRRAIDAAIAEVHAQELQQ